MVQGGLSEKQMADFDKENTESMLPSKCYLKTSLFLVNNMEAKKYFLSLYTLLGFAKAIL